MLAFEGQTKQEKDAGAVDVVLFLKKKTFILKWCWCCCYNTQWSLLQALQGQYHMQRETNLPQLYRDSTQSMQIGSNKHC